MLSEATASLPYLVEGRILPTDALGKESRVSEVRHRKPKVGMLRSRSRHDEVITEFGDRITTGG